MAPVPARRAPLPLPVSSRQGREQRPSRDLPRAPRERRRIRPEAARFQSRRAGLFPLRPGRHPRWPSASMRGSSSTTGEPVPIASSVAAFSQIRRALAGSRPRPRAAWPGCPAGRTRSGSSGSIGPGDESDARGSRKYGQIVLSPDGKRVAAEIADADGRFDLWMIDVARGVGSRLTSDPANERDPVWSPDSQELVFSSDASGDQNLLRKGLQGSEPAAPLPGGIGRARGCGTSRRSGPRGEYAPLH